MKNRIMMSDSYKFSHTTQYPENTVGMFDYAEARSANIYDKTVFFGLQYILKEYFSTPITMDEVREAKNYAVFHGIPFDFEAWSYIAEDLEGKIPVEIKAVPEGKVVPTGCPLFTVESTDKNVFWVVSWLETILMKVWYTSNIATRSYYVRKMLEEYAEATQETPFVAYQYHNFGDRGSSSVESAGIGGVAHLAAGFMGTDNFNSLMYASEYYSAVKEAIAHSIAATEHSTTTSWGKDGEFDMIMNHIEVNKGNPIIAAVMDSYNYPEAVNRVTSGEFKKKIESDKYPIFVIRPDSGDPVQIVSQTLDIMEDNDVAYTENSKGFKVFNKYRIIYGDGITMENMDIMLSVLKDRGYSSENIAFGSGGWLMQQHDRDTQAWAIKCSEITLADGTTRDVFKDPITAPNKKSKKGKLSLYQNYKTGDYITGSPDDPILNDDDWFEVLEVVFRNGELIQEYTLAEVREANK